MKKPKMRLDALLRRRKTNLKKFIEDTGVATWSSMLEMCATLGVEPCEREEFEAVFPPAPLASVNVPSEGIVVVEATDDSAVTSIVDVMIDDIDVSRTKRRSKKKQDE